MFKGVIKFSYIKERNIDITLKHLEEIAEDFQDFMFPDSDRDASVDIHFLDDNIGIWFTIDNFTNVPFIGRYHTIRFSDEDSRIRNEFIKECDELDDALEELCKLIPQYLDIIDDIKKKTNN